MCPISVDAETGPNGTFARFGVLRFKSLLAARWEPS